MRWRLFFVFAFFELAFEGFDGEVDAFFEGVGGLCRDLFAGTWNYHFYDSLFVHGRFGLNDGEVHVDIIDGGIFACEPFDFLVDESCQFFTYIEVDALNAKFHSLSSFFLCTWMCLLIILF